MAAFMQAYAVEAELEAMDKECIGVHRRRKARLHRLVPQTGTGFPLPNISKRTISGYLGTPVSLATVVLMAHDRRSRPRVSSIAPTAWQRRRGRHWTFQCLRYRPAN
jgi:hypothetical protein